MDIDDKKVVEILIGATLVVLLIILVFIVIGMQGNTSRNTTTTSNVIISNSFNTVINNEQINSRDYENDYYNKYYKDSCEEEVRELPFSSRKEHRVVQGVFGNEVDRYYVYVKNLAHTGGYFTVKFYFKNYYGEKDVSSLTKYIDAREEETFIFQNVYEGKYQVTSWSYKVISESKESFGCD